MPENRDLFAEKNTLAVLNVLRQEHRVSRAKIARVTDLTPATVSRIVARLENSGIVRTRGGGESTGGRKPLLVEFLPDAFYLAGVDIGVTKAIALVIDLHGNVVSRERMTLDPEEGREAELSEVLGLAHRAFARLGDARGRLRGIGISMPGLVDAERGIALEAPNLPSWGDTPLVEHFTREFDCFCCLENDARAMTLGEARLGAGRGCRNIFAAIIGRGIGGGMVLNGELYRGKFSTSGEFGHVTVNHAGPTCNCGNRGCLEVMASGTAIAAAALRAVAAGGATVMKEMVGGRLDRITAEVVATAAGQGDLLAQRLMDEAAQYIGIGLADVVNLLGPELIIVGGGVAAAGDVFLEMIRSTVAERAFTYGLARPTFVKAALGDEGSCIGAAALVLEKTLSARPKAASTAARRD